jgi:uncharacterized protein (TIGR02453 family)
MTNTLQFLKNLKENNTREWFEINKPNYLIAKEEFELFTNKIIKGLIKFDKKISPDLKAKDCTFRIYKDVRFSKDKSPYKTNMGASINPGGKKSLIPGYYLHLEPSGSFLAGGVYMPMPEMLHAIRQEIDYNSKPFLKILNSAAFKNYFKGIDEADKLKNPPKGFDKEHPLVEILKNKHFVVSHYFSDKEILNINAEKTIIEGFKAMLPFLEYLREAAGK